MYVDVLVVHHVRSETDYRLLLASNHEIYHHPLSPKVAFELQRIAESMLGRDHRERVEKVTVLSGRIITGICVMLSTYNTFRLLLVFYYRVFAS